MRKTFRYTLLSLRDLAISAGLFTVLAVTLLALAYGWLGPNPSKRVTLATGSTQSANAEFGKRQLTGLRVNLGTAGSGIPSRMGRLLANNIKLSSFKISALEQTPATVAFLEGRLDAHIVASEPASLMVQMLLQTPGTGLPVDALRVHLRIFRWYAQLRGVEHRISQSSSEAASEALRAELDSLEQRAEKIAVPLSYTSELYALRSNIQLVRRKLPV